MYRFTFCKKGISLLKYICEARSQKQEQKIQYDEKTTNCSFATWLYWLCVRNLNQVIFNVEIVSLEGFPIEFLGLFWQFPKWYSQHVNVSYCLILCLNECRIAMNSTVIIPKLSLFLSTPTWQISVEGILTQGKIAERVKIKAV